MNLPGYGQIIGYALATLLGLVGIGVFGRWIAGWQNELSQKAKTDDLEKNKADADQSDQNLNDQMSKLPKG